MTIYKKIRCWGMPFMGLCVAVSVSAQELAKQVDSAPRIGVKTNLLYDATSTLNLGVEFRAGSRTTIDVSGNWNPFTYSNNRKWKHLLIQPEFRLWTVESFSGHFFGAHAHYAYYNVGKLPAALFSTKLTSNRFQGWLAGAGFSYGYRWNFIQNWSMEATIGVGYAYMDYTKYECQTCGRNLGRGTKNYFGATKAGVSFIYTIGKNKKPISLEPVESIEPVSIPEPSPEPQPIVIYEPQFVATFVAPQPEERSQLEKGEAFLDFMVGKTELISNYKNNASGMQQIYHIIEALAENPNTITTRIRVIGYASPEGSYTTNLALSEKRAEALKQHLIKRYSLPESLFIVEGAGEDWATLDSLVSHSEMPNKESIRSIINSVELFDGREKKLMNILGGSAYNEMRSTLFPKLRRIEYMVQYKAIPFTVEKGKELLRTNPEVLSQYELFQLANTYDKGSDAFNDVFRVALHYYPDSDAAHINAAACALLNHDTNTAWAHLDKVREQTDAYWINRGMLHFMAGNTDQAMECFDRLVDQTNPNYLELQKHHLSKRMHE